MSVNPIFPDVFQGGQMTDLPVFSGTLDGTELMEIVAAPSGQTNEASGVNYQITTLLLGALFARLSFTAVVLTQGQHSTPGDPYIPGPFVARIFINKATPEPTYVTFALSSTYYTEPLIKDIAGTVDVGSEVHVAFSGGETADSYAAVPIGTPYGGYTFRPIASLGKWTLGSS